MSLNNRFINEYKNLFPERKNRYIHPDVFEYRIKRYSDILSEIEIGHSEGGRAIREYHWGNGPVKIISWTQMHGNEPTATWASLDVYDFLQRNKALPAIQQLSESIHWIHIPMVNPDGAVAFTRFNGRGVDINRDYHAEEAVETKILKSSIKFHKPSLALNMHDQRSIFTAGDTPFPAILSFLSPSVDSERTMNPTRLKAMNLIGGLVEKLIPYLPKEMGRYTDEFYPNAFGDNIQASGTPIILVESGSAAREMKRESAQKYTAFGLLYLLSNANHSTDKAGLYLALPENKQNYRDWIIREVLMGDKIVDLAFQSVEKIDENGEFVLEWRLEKKNSTLKLYGWDERNYRGMFELPEMEEGLILSKELVDSLELC